MIPNIKKFINNTICASLIEASKIFKLSYIVGSKFASFSLTQIGPGVVGLLGNKKDVNAVFLIRSLYALVLGGLPLSIFALFYHVPTYCGGLYSTLESKILRTTIPLVCIMLFVSHPVGRQAFLYSFYWFIPVGIALMSKRSIFLEALANTFVTHAVGSLIWLYTHSMGCKSFNGIIWTGDENMWNLLIAKVWAERLLIALTMTAAYYLIVYIKEQLKNYNWKQKYDTAFSCYNGWQ